MVCWLALCLGRKVEERLGKKCQGAAGEEEGDWRRGGGGKGEEGSKLQSRNHFRYTHKMVKYVFFLNACGFWIWPPDTKDQLIYLRQVNGQTQSKGKSTSWALAFQVAHITLKVICAWKEHMKLLKDLPGEVSDNTTVLAFLSLRCGELAFFFCGGLLVWGGVPLSG